MALAAHVFPYLTSEAGLKNINFTGDTLQVHLISSVSPAYTWGSGAYGAKSLSDFMLGSGAGAMTEASGTGYSAQTLLSVTFNTATNVNTLSCAPPTWPASSITATYAVFVDTTYTISASPALICYWDFGGTQATTGATFTLSINASGLATWTSN